MFKLPKFLKSEHLNFRIDKLEDKNVMLHYTMKEYAILLGIEQPFKRAKSINHHINYSTMNRIFKRHQQHKLIIDNTWFT